MGGEGRCVVYMRSEGREEVLININQGTLKAPLMPGEVG